MEKGVFDITEFGAKDGKDCTKAIAAAIDHANAFGTPNARGIVKAPVGFDTALIRTNKLPKIDCNIDFRWTRSKAADFENGVLFDFDFENGKHRSAYFRLVEGYGNDVYKRNPFPVRKGSGIRVNNQWYTDFNIGIMAGFKRDIELIGAGSETGVHDNFLRINTIGWCDEAITLWAAGDSGQKRVEFLRAEIDYMVASANYYIGMYDLGGDSRVQDNIIDVIGIEQHIDEGASKAIVLSGPNVFRNEITIRRKITTPKHKTWNLFSVRGANHNTINLPTCDGSKMMADAPNIYSGAYSQPGSNGPGILTEDRGISYLSAPDPSEFNKVFLGIPTICWNSGNSGPAGWRVIKPGRNAKWEAI